MKYAAKRTLCALLALVLVCGLAPAAVQRPLTRKPVHMMKWWNT